MPSNNFTTIMGGQQNYPEQLTVMNTKRGYSLNAGQGGQDGWDEHQLTSYEFDPARDVLIHPDGSITERAFGKNPHHYDFHRSGHGVAIFKDGTVVIRRPGNEYVYNKAGRTHTWDSHHDEMAPQGHWRGNYAGGHYHHAQGDRAHGTGGGQGGAGNHAEMHLGNQNINVQGSITHRAGKVLSIGTQDDGGQLAMYISMSNGQMTIHAKGDLHIESPTGQIKMNASNISLNAQSSMVFNSQSHTVSTSALNLGWDTKKESPLPVTSYSHGEAMADFSSVQEVKTSFAATNALNTDGTTGTA